MTVPRRTNEGRPATPGQALRWVRAYIEIADQLVETTRQLVGKEPKEIETEVQEDLNALADWFDLNPAAADQAWAYVRDHGAQAREAG